MIRFFSIPHNQPGRDNESGKALRLSDSIWTHQVKCRAPFEHDTEIHLWCEERFGPCGSLVRPDKPHESVYLNTSRAWVNTGRHFCFRDPLHAFEFKMAWAGYDQDG